MTLFILDASQYQGTIDFASVASAGITGLVARCVMENDLIDPDFAINIAKSREYGLVPGAYAFLSGGGMATAQAQLFVRTIGNPDGMLIMLDVERPSAHPTPTASDVRAFAKVWYAAFPTHRLKIYGSPGGPLGSLGDLSDCGDLWIADYTTSTTGSPAAIYAADGGDASAVWGRGLWTKPAFWQFSSSDSVPGIAGRVDCSAFRGTLADLNAIIGEEVQLDPSILTSFVADFTPGATVYRDAARTITFDPSWAGGKTIGVVGPDPTNAQGFAAANVCVNLYNPDGSRALVYVGADHVVPGTLRPRDPAVVSDAVSVAVGVLNTQITSLTGSVTQQKATIDTQAATIASLKTQLTGANIALGVAQAKQADLQGQLDTQAPVVAQDAAFVGWFATLKKFLGLP